MTVKIGDSLRTALVSLALANIGIGLILIGTVGLGPVSSVMRDVVGWCMIAQALPVAYQAWKGVLHRAGEELILVNIGFMAFASYQILITGNAPQPVATVGDGVLVVSATAATTVLWARVSGRRLGHEYRRAKQNIRLRRENP